MNQKKKKNPNESRRNRHKNIKEEIDKKGKFVGRTMSSKASSSNITCFLLHFLPNLRGSCFGGSKEKITLLHHFLFPSLFSTKTPLPTIFSPIFSSSFFISLKIVLTKHTLKFKLWMVLLENDNALNITRPKWANTHFKKKI